MLGRKIKKVAEVIHNKYMDQPEDTVEVVRIGDIFVPPEFAKNTPLPYKMKRCKRLFYELGHLDKAITVIAEINEYGKPIKLILVDGYSRYLFALNRKFRRVPVKYQDMNTYVIRN